MCPCHPPQEFSAVTMLGTKQQLYNNIEASPSLQTTSLKNRLKASKQRWQSQNQNINMNTQIQVIKP